MSKEKVEVMVEGGKASAGPAMGQAFGPLGVNIQEILEEINKKTADFKGMKVPVTVTVETDDKSFALEIGTPPVSELIKKEIGLQKGSGLQKLKKSGNVAMEQIIKVARMKMDSMLVKDLKASVKSIIGSCGTLGLLIEGKIPVEINEDLDSGKYDEMIKSEKTEVDEEKKTKLKEDLEKINAELEVEHTKELAKAEEEKPAEEPVEGEAAEGETVEGEEEVKENGDKKEEKKK
ncbi:50S ribosomal protein L11 [archaeon]|nr:50S ribosomal protein L11 [archaeon]